MVFASSLTADREVTPLPPPNRRPPKWRFLIFYLGLVSAFFYFSSTVSSLPPPPVLTFLRALLTCFSPKVPQYVLLLPYSCKFPPCCPPKFEFGYVHFFGFWDCLFTPFGNRVPFCLPPPISDRPNVFLSGMFWARRVMVRVPIYPIDLGIFPVLLYFFFTPLHLLPLF